jgi:hypothetical protein
MDLFLLNKHQEPGIRVLLLVSLQSTKCVLRHSRPQGVRYISMAPAKKFLGLECSTSKQYPKYYIHVLGG